MLKQSSILSSLYYGKISPWENHKTLSNEIMQKNQNIINLHKQISSLLDEKTKVIFDEFIKQNDILSRIHEEEKFCDGFCIGLQMGFEVFTKWNFEFIQYIKAYHCRVDSRIDRSSKLIQSKIYYQHQPPKRVAWNKVCANFGCI